MARAGARSGPSSRMLEKGRSEWLDFLAERDGFVFIEPLMLPENGGLGKPRSGGGNGLGVGRPSQCAFVRNDLRFNFEDWCGFAAKNIASGASAIQTAPSSGGEMAEWLKAHAWKACILQKGIEGSNPSLSASLHFEAGCDTRDGL